MVAFYARDALLKILHNSKPIFFIGVNVNYGAAFFGYII